MSLDIGDVVVTRAANGYIVKDMRPMTVVSEKPYVFESFGSMAKWLEIRLEIRLEGNDS